MHLQDKGCCIFVFSLRTDLSVARMYTPSNVNKIIYDKKCSNMLIVVNFVDLSRKFRGLKTRVCCLMFVL